MAPGAGREAVIARQRVRQDIHIRRTLDVVVAAEDVRLAAGDARVSERQLQDAIGAGIIVAVGMLRAVHAPDQGPGPVVGQGSGADPPTVFRLKNRSGNKGHTEEVRRG